VIDLGMGNLGTARDFLIEKLAEKPYDTDKHAYSKSNGIANMRREVIRST